MDSTATDRFEASRNRLASLAYRLLGSAADAEDAVQDAFLRWQAADRDLIEVPDAWLTKIVTNRCLDQLRSAKTRRERSVGAWLPEPLLDGDPMLGPADIAEQRESVSLAMLLLLERLGPIERAVYVLREAFSHSHAEIAEILDITEPGSQQHASRARRRLAAARRPSAVDRAGARRIVAAFLDAAASGQTERLIALLTDDATAVSDGVGMAKKLIELSTPERISAASRGAFSPSSGARARIVGAPAIHAELVNGAPAAIGVLDGRVVGMVVFEVSGDRISGAIGLASPTRLGRVNEQWRQSEHEAPLIEAW